MTKMYVVNKVDMDGYMDVQGVFTTRKKAEEYINTCKASWELYDYSYTITTWAPDNPIPVKKSERQKLAEKKLKKLLPLWNDGNHIFMDVRFDSKMSAFWELKDMVNEAYRFGNSRSELKIEIDGQFVNLNIVEK